MSKTTQRERDCRRRRIETGGNWIAPGTLAPDMLRLIDDADRCAALENEADEAQEEAKNEGIQEGYDQGYQMGWESRNDEIAGLKATIDRMRSERHTPERSER